MNFSLSFALSAPYNFLKVLMNFHYHSIRTSHTHQSKALAMLSRHSTTEIDANLVCFLISLKFLLD